MTAELTPTEQEHEQHKVIIQGSSNSVYSIGAIGAWVYYFKRATTPQERVKAFFKGLAWPAFLVYELLKFLEKD